MELSPMISSAMILPLCSSVFAGIQEAAFKKTITKEVGLKYVVFLPDDYDAKSSRKWPTILFLHGIGERGDDLKVIEDTPVLRHAKNAKGFPFIVIAPQCPADEYWSPDALNALMDEVEAEYLVDKNRVYLTGLSMGGTGTWMLAMDYPNRFAAIAPICGRAMPPSAVKIKNLPIWVFHGDADQVVHICSSEVMVAHLKRAGAEDVQFTVYPGMDHNVWDVTYENPKLYEWFLSHKKVSK